MNNDIMEEILNRTKLGWRKFGQLNIVFKSNMPFCLKRKLFDQCVLPVLTYGCETWTLNSKSTVEPRYNAPRHNANSDITRS